MNEEALEARNTGSSEGQQSGGVAAHHSTPSRPIHPGTSSGRGALGVQSPRVGGLGHTVQGHIHKRCDSAECRGSRGRRKTLPLGSAGIIDMNVRVHQAGKQDIFAKIVKLRGLRHVAPGTHLGDPLVLNQQGCRSESLLRKNAC